MNQEWFEMQDIRRKNFDKSVWIPLRAVLSKEKKGRYGYEGYKEDFFGSGSIAVPNDKVEEAKKLGWMDIGINHNHSGWVDDGKYIPAEIYQDYSGEFEGVHLVLDQISQDDDPNVWHLNQDLVVTLGLKREGDSWVCPNDGYVEVARLELSENNKPVLLEIKSQYLKDYLCARDMALYMTHYFNRDTILNSASHIVWEDGNNKYKDELDFWEGRVAEIHEGGDPFGGKMAVFHVARTDVDETDDVPDISGIPTDENTHGVHFGVNELGLINVYAKDIGLLPEWQQQIWAGYNITPEGGVSNKLLASQVKAQPAETKAPEQFLGKGIELVNKLAMEKLNIQIFREHDAIPQLIEKTHRFRAVDEQSFFALAKDLARLIADSLDAQAMQTIVTPPKKEKWGSLKSLENLLASKYDRELVRKITSSLVGVYELRHADAHLPRFC